MDYMIIYVYGIDVSHLQEGALRLLAASRHHFRCQKTLVRLSVPRGATLHVVGDLHGQLCELMTVLTRCGLPSTRNWLLFNGDFVDRGGRSVEERAEGCALDPVADGVYF